MFFGVCLARGGNFCDFAGRIHNSPDGASNAFAISGFPFGLEDQQGMLIRTALHFWLNAGHFREASVDLAADTFEQLAVHQITLASAAAQKGR